MQAAILKTLKHYFGFDQFRSGQQSVVEAILEGRSAAAIFPTGSGKSLCYQLSALHLPHLTLVVSPLLALMKDQLDFLQSKNIAAASIDSTQNREQSQKVLADVRSGKIKILMISVERLSNERFRRFIQSIDISLLVVDEAHCISEWGHNFRPDYMKLPQYQSQLNIKQVLLLTATATPKVISDMENIFSIAKSDVVKTGFYRSNLNIKIVGIIEKKKLQSLREILKNTATVDNLQAASIVYVTLQKTAHEVADYLQADGINAEAYHAGLKAEDREAIQRRFMQGITPCVVATIAFGMGVDKSNIRRVIHYDLPKSIENYSQEIGRAGRDGMASDCILLASKESVHIIENFIYGDTPELAAILRLLKKLQHETAHTQWQMMLNRTSLDSNIRQLPLKTLLVYLELSGMIKPLFSFYADYRFKLRVSESDFLQTFSGERQQFLKALLQQSKKGHSWFTVDFDSLYSAYPVNDSQLAGYASIRERAVAALEFCDESSLIILESKKMTHVYDVSETFSELGQTEMDDLALQLFQRFKARQENELGRIGQMLNLFESTSCLTQKLCRYFGDMELTSGCGHCSCCLQEPAILPTSEEPAPLFNTDFETLAMPLFDKAKRQNLALSVDVFAHYFCGLRSPYLSTLKAGSLSGFGYFESYPYAQVKQWLLQNDQCEAMIMHVNEGL